MWGTKGRLARSRRLTSVSATAAVIFLALALPAGAEPGLSAVQYLPKDAGAPVKGTEQFSSVSCPTLSNCTAAGPGYQGVAGSTASVASANSGIR